MMRFTMLFLALLCAAPAAAQDNPWHWSAERLLDEWRSGANRYAMGMAFMECPAESARHDSIFRGLIEMSHDFDSAIRIASRWTDAQLRCGDPRLRNWYLEQIRGAATERQATTIASVFVGNADAQGVAGFTAWLLDPARTVAARERGVELVLTRRFAMEDHLTLFLALYPLYPLPQSLRSGLFDIQTGLGDRGRVALLDAVLARPDAPSAAGVLESLRNYTVYWSEPHSTFWLQRFGAGLERLRADPQGRVPPDVAAAAERALGQLIAAGKLPRE